MRLFACNAAQTPIVVPILIFFWYNPRPGNPLPNLQGVMLSDSVAVHTRCIAACGGLMAWLICLSAGLFFFYEFFQLNLFDVINQPLRDEFHIGAEKLSWMSSTYLWANILFLLPAGIILDRYSTRFVILAAMLICVVSTIGFALTESFFLASVCHFLSGIGNAFCFLSCVVLVSRWFPSRRQAFVIGCVVTMAFLGGMMAHTPLAYLVEHLGWRQALLIDGGVGVLFLEWIFIFVKDKPNEPLVSHQTHNKKPTPTFLPALLNSQNWVAGLYTSCLNLPILVLAALWGTSYLKVVYNLPEMAANNVVSLLFMGSIIGCPLAGWLSDKFGRRKPFMIFGALATGLTMLPLLMGISLSESEISVLFFALGVFTSTQVISYPLISESNGAQNTGSATGIASVIIMGGGGVGQIMFGGLMAHHAGSDIQQYAVHDFQFAMGLFSVTILIGFMAALLVRETYCQREKGA